MTRTQAFPIQREVKRLLDLCSDDSETDTCLNPFGRSEKKYKNKWSSPVNGAYAGHRVAVAYALRQQPVSDFPSEHGGILPLILCNFLHNFWRGHFWLGASNHAGLDAASLVVADEEDS